MSVFIVLLRAIGPGTHQLMSMTQWREAVESHGFRAAETYLATGNMIVEGDGTPREVEQRMNRLVQGFGLGTGNTAVVRTPGRLQRLLKADPFPQASADRPSEMGIYFFVKPRPNFDWVHDYEGTERIHIEGGHLIVDYSGRISNSPKLPGLIEKRSGTCTARNWNTLKGLAARAASRTKRD